MGLLTAACFASACQDDPTSRQERLRDHVTVLSSEAFEGRATGRAGERLAARYLADEFRAIGLIAEGESGFLQPFGFTAGVRLGVGNRLAMDGNIEAGDLELDRDWRPLAFSESGSFGPVPLVFGGYGFAAPAAADIPAVDSYGEVDVQGAWLVVLRDWPDRATDRERQHWGRYAGLRYKAILARERGAAGLIVVGRSVKEKRAQSAGVRSAVPPRSLGSLVPLHFDGTVGSAGIAALSLHEESLDALLRATGHTTRSLRERLDAGEAIGAFAIPDASLRAEIRLELEKSSGVNVIGRLGVGDPKAPAVVVGAHYDHLGRAARRGSLAGPEERAGIHYGADDNASGVAAVLEIARGLRQRIDAGTLVPVRDVIFGAWSGEEVGLLGSHDFVTRAGEAEADAPDPPSGEGTHGVHSAHGDGGRRDLRGRFAANLNLDMVGRLQETLLLQGGGSSSAWSELVADANAAMRAPLPFELQSDSLLPTDASSFVTRGVPVLSAFTGAHREYHTPRDTAEKLNYGGLDSVTELFTEIADALVRDVDPPDFVAPRHKGREAGAHPRRAVRLRAYLGTIPDYATAVEGLALSAVVQGGPAARAGLRGGDIVTALSGRPILNVYDYTFAIEALRPGEPVPVVIDRNGTQVELEITPESRE